MRFALPLSLLMLVCAGCSSAEKKAARQAEKERIENSRAVEERRMRAVDGREIASERAAEIYVADPNKTFDPHKTPGFGSRSFSAKGSQVRDFRYAQRVESTGFRTKDFVGSKTASMRDSKYETSSARTKDFAAASKTMDTKTAATKDAREASKTMATRDLSDGNRTYLGPEAERVKKPLDQTALPRTTNDLRELKSVEDIRELLNKNK